MRKRSAAPRARRVEMVCLALLNHIESSRPDCSWGESLNGTPRMRYAATTKGVDWTVDIYNGHYYRAHVGNGVGDVFRSLPSLIGYLKRRLGL